jgi:hypothetical protein
MLFTRANNFRKSYSQQGEDLIVDFIFQTYKCQCKSFIDIGANHPVRLSNSYFFYKKGASGICVDPNESFKNLYKRTRPRDQFIACGITGGKSTEMPYYVMDWHEFNTFDKIFAEETARKYKGRNSIKSVIDLPIINVNEFLEASAKREIDFLNLDVEGLDAQILKTWDFSLFKPKVICVESNTSIQKALNSESAEILQINGYCIDGMNHVNTVFSTFRS